MTRFRAGDVVILNGHRLIVAANTERQTWADLYDGPSLVASVETSLLPDPEPRQDARSRLEHFARRAEADGYAAALRNTWKGDAFRQFLADLHTVTMPEPWLPDPEPRAEPDWQPGDVVRDAEERIYQRVAHGTRPWRQLGEHVGENILVHPLVRLVPETDNPALRMCGWQP